jgi:UPF0042 nucleotide-binding protein
VVLAGLSGAGRTTALAALEDLGYFTADNVPPALWDELVTQADPVQPRVAVGVGVRTAVFFAETHRRPRGAARARHPPQVVFLDASSETLIRRYNFTRRTHPLGHAPLAQDIASEREVLGELRAGRRHGLDTSGLSARGPHRGALGAFRRRPQVPASPRLVRL